MYTIKKRLIFCCKYLIFNIEITEFEPATINTKISMVMYFISERKYKMNAMNNIVIRKMLPEKYPLMEDINV